MYKKLNVKLENLKNETSYSIKITQFLTKNFLFNSKMQSFSLFEVFQKICCFMLTWVNQLVSLVCTVSHWSNVVKAFIKHSLHVAASGLDIL